MKKICIMVLFVMFACAACGNKEQNAEQMKTGIPELEEASRIKLNEYTDNNFTEGVSTYLEDSLVIELRDIREDIALTETEDGERGEIFYQLHIYDESGSNLCRWTIYQSGQIYNGSGYDLSGDELNAWLSKIEDTYF